MKTKLKPAKNLPGAVVCEYCKQVTVPPILEIKLGIIPKECANDSCPSRKGKA